MPMEIEIEIGEGEGERKTETVRHREKEREEWGSQRHCCRSLIFFDPISVFFSASHSRSITRPLTHSLQDTHEKAFHCAVATATVHLLLLRDSLLPTSVDADGNGTIDYDEFIATTMHLNWMDREHLYTTFQHFDKDSSGYTMMEELEQVLHKYVMHDSEEEEEEERRRGRKKEE
ncbi:hypothetical protein TB2_027764 [Malus domestica]